MNLTIYFLSSISFAIVLTLCLLGVYVLFVVFSCTVMNKDCSKMNILIVFVY